MSGERAATCLVLALGSAINAGLAAWNFIRLPEDANAVFAGPFCTGIAVFLALGAICGGDR